MATSDQRQRRQWAVGLLCGLTVACSIPDATHAETPDWLHHRTGGRLVDGTAPPAGSDLCVVLQEDRPDGTELVTARYTMRDQGALRTYVGAGVNRAQYFHDAGDDDPGPTLFNRRNRHTSFGVAAELGAELHVTRRVLLSADLRWADLDARAEALRAEHGPVAADSLLLGLVVGYRFR